MYRSRYRAVMSGLSGLSNHCRERSFLIWAAVGFFPLGIGVSSPYPSFPRRRESMQVSVMRALSPGIRIRGLPCPGRFERDLELVAGRARIALQRARRRLHAPALESRDDRARGFHSRRELLLRQTCARTCTNHLACQLEFLVQVCHGLGIAGALLEPLLMKLIYSRHVTSIARFRASSISRRGVFCVFLTNTRTTTTRCPRAVT